jgi:hypothetical protein
MKNPRDKNDEISLFDILIYIKLSFINIILAVIVSFMVGATFYFLQTDIYILSAIIEVKNFDNKPVKNIETLLIQVNKPSYFSSSTIQACNTKQNQKSYNILDKKIKILLDQKSKDIVIEAQVESVGKGKDCIHLIVDEINKKNEEGAEIFIREKKQELEQLKQIRKYLDNIIIHNQKASSSESSKVSTNLIIASDGMQFISKLPANIYKLDYEILNYNKNKTLDVVSLYSDESPVNKKPSIIISACLLFGVIFGLMINGLKGKIIASRSV